jgi:hypothetical protein
MVQFMGWLGFWALVGSMVPLVLRRLRLQQMKAKYYTRYHHYLALASLGLLSLHGILALGGGGYGWRRGFRWHFNDIMLGIITWSVLFAVCLLAIKAGRQVPFPRTHCWLVALLVVFLFLHAF